MLSDKPPRLAACGRVDFMQVFGLVSSEVKVSG